MTACEEFELAIEMKLHSALDSARAAALDHHLKSCAPCRSFQNLAKQMESDMTSEAALQAQRVNWDVMRDRIKATLKADYRRALRSGAMVALLALPAVVLMNEKPSDVLPATALVWPIAFAALWLRNQRRVQELNDVQKHQGEFLYKYRRDLEKRLQSTQIGLVAAPLLALLASMHYLRAIETAPSRFWASIVLVLIVTGAALHNFLAVRPNLKRQLETLKR